MRGMHIGLAVLTARLCWAGSASASFSTVNPPPSNEPSHPQILSNAYGGTFVATGAGSLNYTNGVVTAVRIDDIANTGPSAPNSVMGPLNGDDQIWQANFSSASAESLWGVYQQQFGYFLGASGGTYVNLFNETGYGFNVQGSADLTSLSGQVLRWGRAGENRVFSSQISDNTSDNHDHMVTYRIDGLPDANTGIITYDLFWEDKFVGEQAFDDDYQDEVVQIKAYPLNLSPAPEPASIGLLSLGGLAALTRRRRR